MTGFRNSLATAAMTVAATTALTSAALAGPYSVRWGGSFEREINPLYYDNGSGNYRTAAQYYSYSSPFGAPANTPDNLEESETLTMFLYEDPNNGLSLFHIYDRPNDPTG